MKGCQRLGPKDTGRHWSSDDITNWDYLKKLNDRGKDTTPLVHPIMGFGG